jgi:hypothetical protein
MDFFHRTSYDGTPTVYPATGSSIYNQRRAVAMQNALIDFLNHGLLPFSGREAELERIVAFWRATTHASRLRTFLLTGEAGIGKSRLLEEAIREVMDQGAAVVQARLYPGAANAPASLLAHALWNSGAGRRLLPRQPESTLPSVAAALRRMSRLRPTLLVIEDIHLLNGDALAETASLLTMISDETLSLLCSARPVENTTRAILEQSLVEEHVLSGLNDTTLLTIWSALFGTEVEEDVEQAVRMTTLGNPLAVRSALRGAMSTGALAQDPDTGRWRSTVKLPAFTAALRRYVGLLADGMAAHLTQPELHAATALACLGEIFSPETAAAAIDDAPRMLESLTFKGIIVTSNNVRPPISGTAGVSPLLGFAHTLLHQQLAEHSALEPDRIASILARDLPLYSILPFRLLAEHAPGPDIAPDLRRMAIDHSLDVATTLDTTRNWELAIVPWQAAWALYQSHTPLWPDDEARTLHVRLAIHRLGLLRRRNHTDEFITLANEALALTDSPDTAFITRQRFHVLRHQLWIEFRRQPQAFGMEWGEVDVLVQRFPEVVVSEAYLMLLRDLIQLAGSLANIPLLREAEKRLESALTCELATDATNDMVFQQVYVHLLVIFETPEELQRRMDLLPRIEACVAPTNASFQMAKARLLEETGRYRELIDVLDRVTARMNDLGMAVGVHTGGMMRLAADTALGANMDVVIERGRRLCAEAPTEGAARAPGEIGIRLVCIALMRGEVDTARSIFQEFMNGHSIWPMLDLVMELLDGNAERALEIAATGGHECPAAQMIAQAIRTSSTETCESAASTLGAFLASPVLRITDILSDHAVLGMLRLFDDRAVIRQLAEQSRDRMQSRLHGSLEWLRERGLTAIMASLIARYGDLLPSREVNRWKQYCRQEEHNQTATPLPLPVRIELSMLGTIVLESATGEQVHLRTGRLRTLLGVFVADCMIETPLTLQEFRELVTGESDSDLARKGTNLAVHRLREAIGHDAIITGDEAPRLNRDYVHVDLLDVHEHLKSARNGLRQGLPMRACVELLAALELLHGEVAFPGLYDDFFEAIREDLEVELRSVIMDIARLLVEEGDIAMAADILHRGADALPGDDELTEMLRDALLRDGRHVEAGRVV